MIEQKRFKDKLSGKVRFPEDMSSKRTYTGKVIRSTVSHGKIKEIHIPEIPGSIIVLSYKDIPGVNRISVPDGSVPFLAEDTVLYKGEAILLTAGSDEEELMNFISKIQIEYEILDEIKPPENDEDYVAVREVIKGEPEEVMKQGWQIFHSQLSTPSQEHMSTPLLSAYGKVDGQKAVINTITQWPVNVLQNVSSVTGLLKKNITVKINPSGKSLDSKIWMPSVVAAQAALLSMKCKKPVRLIYTAQEDFLCSPKRIPASFKYKASIDESGKLTALIISILLDTGSRKMMTDEILDRICLGAAGVYQCRNIKVTGKVYTSNKAPMGAFSGFGLAQAFFASERMATIISERLIAIQKKEIYRLIDEATERKDENKLKSAKSRTTTDPALWREKNFLIKGNTYLSGGKLKKAPPINKLLNNILIKSDFTRKFAAYSNVWQNRDKLKTRPSGRRGIGISTAYMGSNFLRKEKFLSSTSVICKLDKEGILTIITPSIPDNFVLLKLWKQSASEILSIEENKIQIINDEENKILIAGPATLSRNITITMKLMILCCEQIKKKRFRDPLPLEVRKSFMNYSERKWDTVSFSGIPFHELSWGACAVEVEINENTFMPLIRKVWVSLDCGSILNKNSANAEVESEMMQAIGWCSIEDLPFKGNSITSADISTYIIPGIYEQPEISIDFLESNNKIAKGLGGLVLNSLPAAYCSAVSQATGFEFTSIPIRPHKVYSALEDK
ncbi:MAG: molybdopterin-dependent oxidoreductase [Spirochaetaceae bacterium]|jgi:CO/xanthine dehydrogenase Mo-binding subunit|nr:molybdopterin-dependent oxidoreductase [Spirochaetaceae bacterium]